jgi:CRP-like cAMP-binding protein
VPEEVEDIVATALQKDAQNRYATGLELAAALTSVFHDLRAKHKQLDQKEQFDMLRKLRFFHDFSHEEIWEVLRASEWRDYGEGDEIVREGEMDDRFYVVVSGRVGVKSGRRAVGEMGIGDCFGETSYVSGARRTATISALGPVTLISVSSTLLEQASSDCQLRFNKMFLRSLIERLQGVGQSPRT